MTKTIEEKIETQVRLLYIQGYNDGSFNSKEREDKCINEAKQALLTLIREIGEEVIGKYESYPLSEITTTYAKIIDARNSLWKEQRSRLNKLVGGK